MIELIFAVILMVIWSYEDWKHASIPAITLLPVIVLPFLNLSMFAFIFLPMFFCLLIISRLLPSLGFADVIAVPFGLFFLLELNLMGVMVFPIALGSIFIICKLSGTLHHYDREERINFKNKTKFIPVLTAAFIISVVAHIIANMMFPGLFL